MWEKFGKRASRGMDGVYERRQLVLREADYVIHGAICLDCGLMGRAALALALCDWDLADLITADMQGSAGITPEGLGA